MSRVLPILFNTEMVRAILRKLSPKTTTRRCIKGYIPKDARWGYTMFTPNGCISCRGTFSGEYGEKFFKLPYQPGDILYVRETWAQSTDLFGEFPEYIYRTDYGETEDDSFPPSMFKWRPSIHMPKDAARIWLKVTDVRVERLQDITEEQAAAEGAIDNRGFIHSTENEYDSIHSAREHFIKIWDSTVKKKELALYGWDANPWVWVIEFERCEKPEE